MHLGKRIPNTSGHRTSSFGNPLEPLEPRTLLSFALSDTGPTLLNRDDGITSSVAFDWDADGKQDLLVASGREVLFLKGDGLGRFQPPRSLVRLSNPIGLLALNPDSTPQRFSLFSAQIGSSLESIGNLRELVPDGSGGLRVRAATTISQIVSITPIRSASDQPVDLLVHTRRNTAMFGTLDSFDSLLVLRRTPAGRFVAASDFLLSNISTSRFSTPGVFDLDGDGKSEIVVSRTVGRDESAVSDLRVYSIINSQFVLRAEVTDTGTISQIVVNDLDGDGIQEAVFGRLRSYQGPAPLGRRWTQLVESTPIIVSGFGSASTISFGMSRVHVDRTLALSDDFTPTVDFRVIDVRDMNGDQRPDIVSTASYGDDFNERTFFFRRRITLSQHSQRVDGSFADTVIRSRFTEFRSPQRTDWSTLDLSRSFAVVSVRGAGRPDVLALDRPALVSGLSPDPRNQTSLTLLRTISAFRTPKVNAIALQRVFSEIANFQGNGTNVYEGDIVRLTIDIRLPDASRFVGVQSVRLFRDSNGNGRLDSSDEAIGTGVQVTVGPPSSPSFVSTGITRWAVRFTIGPWDIGPQRLFAQITDTRGVSSDPLAASPVITLR